MSGNRDNSLSAIVRDVMAGSNQILDNLINSMSSMGNLVRQEVSGTNIAGVDTNISTDQPS